MSAPTCSSQIELEVRLAGHVDTRQRPGRLALASWVLLTLVASLPPPSLFAFNVDTQSAVVHQGPAGSYFGYTVAQHRDRGVSWLLVGAPKAQTDQPLTQNAGAVYRCAPNNSKACQQIPFDPNGSSVIQLEKEKKQSDDKSHQWFGASLQSATENGSIVACAPKYVYYSSNLRRRDPVGTCWVSRGSFSGFLEYSPCRLNGKCCSIRLSCRCVSSSLLLTSELATQINGVTITWALAKPASRAPSPG